MASHNRIQYFLALIPLLISSFNVSGQPNSIYTSGSNFGEKGIHSHFPSDEGSSLFLSKPTLGDCPIDNQLTDFQREARDETVKVPLVRFDNSPRLFEDRYYLPMGRFRSKKAQKAILLDVGDYVIKGNGVMDGGAARSPSAMGGSLRSSGKK